MMFPQTGFRIRREYRRITDMERMMFHAAVNTLKMVSAESVRRLVQKWPVKDGVDVSSKKV